MIPIYLCIYYTLLLTSFYRQSLPWTPGSIALDLQSSYLRQYQASSHVVKDKIKLSFLPFESSLQTPSPAPAALVELICYSDAVKKKGWSSCWSQFDMYFWAKFDKKLRCDHGILKISKYCLAAHNKQLHHHETTSTWDQMVVVDYFGFKSTRISKRVWLINNFLCCVI